MKYKFTTQIVPTCNENDLDNKAKTTLEISDGKRTRNYKITNSLKTIKYSDTFGYERIESAMVFDNDTNKTLFIDDEVMKIDGKVVAKIDCGTDEAIRGRSIISSVDGYSKVHWDCSSLPAVEKVIKDDIRTTIIYRTKYKNDPNIMVTFYPNEKRGHMRITHGNRVRMSLNFSYSYIEGAGILTTSLNSFTTNMGSGYSVKLNKKSIDCNRCYQELEFGETNVIPIKIGDEYIKVKMYKVEHLGVDTLFDISIGDHLKIAKKEVKRIFTENINDNCDLPNWISGMTIADTMISSDDDIYIISRKKNKQPYEEEDIAFIVVDNIDTAYGDKHVVRHVVVKVSKRGIEPPIYSVYELEYNNPSKNVSFNFYNNDNCEMSYVRHIGTKKYGYEYEIDSFKTNYFESVSCVSKFNKDIITKEIETDTYIDTVFPNFGGDGYVSNLKTYWNNRKFGLSDGGNVKPLYCFEPASIYKMLVTALPTAKYIADWFGCDNVTDYYTMAHDTDVVSRIIHTKYIEYSRKLDVYLKTHGIECNTLGGVDIYDIIGKAYIDILMHEKTGEYERYPEQGLFNGGEAEN